MANSFKYKEEEYSVGDCILLNPGAGTLDYVGQIKRIGPPHRSGNAKAQKLKVAWFYRPEDVLGGRKLFHGKHELFTSDHVDEVEVGTIKHKCQVLSLESYQGLPRPVAENVFYTRALYSASKKTFKPDKWSIYCLCNMPFNPDLEMVQCGKCNEYFHKHCLAERQQGRPIPKQFVCERCQAPKPLAT